jgi:hypothetical protein
LGYVDATSAQAAETLDADGMNKLISGPAGPFDNGYSLFPGPSEERQPWL